MRAWIPWLLPLASTAVLARAWSASAVPDDLPPRPVARGAPITSGTAGSLALAPEPGGADDVGPPAPDAVLELERFAFDDYDPPELRADAAPLPRDAFPERTRVLDGGTWTVAGYALATRFEGDRVAELMLSRFPPGCCFGARPVLDEWMLVELAEPVPARAAVDRVEVRGRVEVGEQQDRTGFVTSLYRLREATLVE